MADNASEDWETQYPALIPRNRPAINNGSDLNTPPNLRGRRVPPASPIDPSAIIRNGASQSQIDAATIHLTIAVRAWRLGIQDIFSTAIKALKKVNFVDLAKALSRWASQNPRTVSMIGCVLVPLMCAGLTLPILGVIGFGSGGILTGSIAAGIQAGIGNVAAASFFATLTSATMGGYGLPIVIGTVLGVTSAVSWGTAVWRGWFKGADGNGGRGEHGGGNEDGDGDEDEDDEVGFKKISYDKAEVKAEGIEAEM